MNTYIIFDTEKEEVVKDFLAGNDDEAIACLFSLSSPPPANYNLYQTGTSGFGGEEKFEMAKIVYIPDEITEDGDYIFDGSVRKEN